MTILHLLVDDKFIDSAIREFEHCAPGVSEYLIIEKAPPFRYLRSPQVRAVSPAYWAERVRQPDVRGVVLHSLPRHHYQPVQAIPAGPTVVWLGWGFDYYGLISDAFPAGLYGPKTSRALARLQPRRATFGAGLLQASELSLARPYAKPTQGDRVVLSRIDVFSPVLDVEHALVRRHQPWFCARYLPWNYGTLEDDLTIERPVDRGPGGDILLGNSATPANNHLEAFDLIQKVLPPDGRRIVAPLSYGSAAYAELVARAGRERFGAAFVPVRAFMPKDEYIKLLHSCGTVVMNHVRQQAMGNLFIAGLIGARLFLDPRNPALRWLQRHGVQAESVHQLHWEPLGHEERIGNADAIARLTSRATRRAQTVGLIEQLLPVAPSMAAA